MDKKIKKPSVQKNKMSFKNKMGMKLATLALALGIGGYAVMGKSNEEKVTFGVTKDVANDSYEKSIPIFKDKRGRTLITTVNENVLIVSKEEVNPKEKQLYLVSAIYPNNEIVSGYVPGKNLDNIIEYDIENMPFLYRVNSDNGINLRKTAELGDNRMVGIPNNAILIGSIPENDLHLWCNVLYYNGNSINKGYVSGQYLEKVGDFTGLVALKNEMLYKNINKNNLDKEENYIVKQDVSNYIDKDDEVLGIDVSFIDPKRLDEILKGQFKVPENFKQVSGQISDLSQYANKKIDFVYLRLYSSASQAKEIKEGLRPDYLELAKVCEKNGIPFGVYCYTACKNSKEADYELNIIEERLEKLKEFKNHVLPIAVDVEYANENDRQYGSNIREFTSSKAKIANSIEEKFGKTILYISRNICDPALATRIFDLEQYERELNSGYTDVWFVAPEGNKKHKESLDKIKKYVTMRQVALNMSTDKNISNVIDVNSMSGRAFELYTNGIYKIREDSKLVASKEYER